MSKINTLVNALILVVVVVALSVPVIIWFSVTGDDGPMQVPGGSTQYDPRRIFGPQDGVLEALVPDTSGAAVRRAEVAVEGADDFAGTATVMPTGDAPYAVVGIRHVGAGAFYEFRGRRHDRFSLSTIDVEGSASEALYVPTALSFWETEVRLSLGAGYAGEAVFFGSVSLLRVWGFHLGWTVGIERGTADVITGPQVSALAYRTMAVQVSYDLNAERVWAGLSLMF